jgi:hypothetical protein
MDTTRGETTAALSVVRGGDVESAAQGEGGAMKPENENREARFCEPCGRRLFQCKCADASKMAFDFFEESANIVQPEKKQKREGALDASQPVH